MLQDTSSFFITKKKSSKYKASSLINSTGKMLLSVLYPNSGILPTIHLAPAYL